MHNIFLNTKGTRFPIFSLLELKLHLAEKSIKNVIYIYNNTFGFMGLICSLCKHFKASTACELACHIIHTLMRESNRNLDIPPPGIPGEFACLVFEEGGNLNFFLVEGGEFA